MAKKAPKARTEKQLANDERLRQMRKKPDAPASVAPPVPDPIAADEPEFEPTDVTEAKAAGKLETAEPPITDEVVPAEAPAAPVGPSLEAPKNLSMEDMMAMMLQTQQMVVQLIATNPKAASATPEQRLDETVRMVGDPNPNQTDFNQARVGRNGIQGVVFKYPIDKNYYADPSERLLAETKLARYAMKENYLFRWSVDGVEYEKHGVTYAEPRFTLELFRYLDDPETGERNGKMGLVARQMQHEDEMFTRMAAMKLGILEKFDSFEELMTEIRYIRMQQWLFDLFTPAKIEQHNRRATTQVIAGKAVEVFDTEKLTDSETGASQAEAIRSADGIGKVTTPRI